MKRSRSAMIGAAGGFLVFLGIGLLPVLGFTWSMGRMLAGVVFGRPLVDGPMTTLFIAGAMIVAFIAVASLFTVAGSAVAGAIGYFTRMAKVARRRRNGAAQRRH